VKYTSYEALHCTVLSSQEPLPP